MKRLATIWCSNNLTLMCGGVLPFPYSEFGLIWGIRLRYTLVEAVGFSPFFLFFLAVLGFPCGILGRICCAVHALTILAGFSRGLF